VAGSLFDCTSLGIYTLVLPTQCSHVHVRRPYDIFVHQPARLSAADTGIFCVVCVWCVRGLTVYVRRSGTATATGAPALISGAVSFDPWRNPVHRISE